MDYAFLVETYAAERLKTLSVWSMFADEDLNVRPIRGSRAIARRASTWSTSA